MRWEAFEPCPQCGWDFATDEGTRACALSDCAYLPEELNVYCDYCRFNLYTMQGNSPCDDPAACEHAVRFGWQGNAGCPHSISPFERAAPEEQRHGDSSKPPARPMEMIRMLRRPAV